MVPNDFHLRIRHTLGIPPRTQADHVSITGKRHLDNTWPHCTITLCRWKQHREYKVKVKVKYLVCFRQNISSKVAYRLMNGPLLWSIHSFFLFTASKNREYLSFWYIPLKMEATSIALLLMQVSKNLCWKNENIAFRNKFVSKEIKDSTFSFHCLERKPLYGRAT